MFTLIVFVCILVSVSQCQHNIGSIPSLGSIQQATEPFQPVQSHVPTANVVYAPNGRAPPIREELTPLFGGWVVPRPTVAREPIVCGTDKQCLLNYISSNRLFIVTKATDLYDRVVIHYTEEGLTSVFKDPSYYNLRNYINSPIPKTATLVTSDKLYTLSLLNKSIDKIMVPQHFKLSDFEILAKVSDKIPFLVINEGVQGPSMNSWGNFNVLNGNFQPLY